MSIRPLKRLIKSKPTLEGAGVHLRRAFGFGNPHDFDPFLLLDDSRNDVPEDYLAGFPWHPHRGMNDHLRSAGTVEHGDSMGNKGAIAAGDVQWITSDLGTEGLRSGSPGRVRLPPRRRSRGQATLAGQPSRWMSMATRPARRPLRAPCTRGASRQRKPAHLLVKSRPHSP